MGRKFSKMTDAVLNAVADGIEILEYSVYKPGALMRYGYPFIKEIENDRARRQMRSATWRLKRKGYIENSREMQGRAFRLTELGGKILRSKESASINPVALPDNIYLIVSFDVPEKYKRARQNFRCVLKTLGFRRQHLSVWISDKDWTAYLEKMLEELKINDWVVLMKGEFLFPKPSLKHQFTNLP
jgi:DNA-binding PadR family transcriptional regulator